MSVNPDRWTHGRMKRQRGCAPPRPTRTTRPQSRDAVSKSIPYPSLLCGLSAIDAWPIDELRPRPSVLSMDGAGIVPFCPSVGPSSLFPEPFRLSARRKCIRNHGGTDGDGQNPCPFVRCPSSMTHDRRTDDRGPRPSVIFSPWGRATWTPSPRCPSVRPVSTGTMRAPVVRSVRPLVLREIPTRTPSRQTGILGGSPPEGTDTIRTKLATESQPRPSVHRIPGTSHELRADSRRVQTDGRGAPVGPSDRREFPGRADGRGQRADHALADHALAPRLTT